MTEEHKPNTNASGTEVEVRRHPGGETYDRTYHEPFDYYIQTLDKSSPIWEQMLNQQGEIISGLIFNDGTIIWAKGSGIHSFLYTHPQRNFEDIVAKVGGLFSQYTNNKEIWIWAEDTTVIDKFAHY